jgi:hypothetical protein
MKYLLEIGFEYIREEVNRVLRGADSNKIACLRGFELIYRLLRRYKNKLRNQTLFSYEEFKLIEI